MVSRLFRPQSHCAAKQLFFIYNSKFLSQCSTSSANVSEKTHFLVNYLVNSLGFSQEEAISTETKVYRFKYTENPQFVLNLLEKFDLDKTHIRNVVSVVPNLLLCDAENTLKPKLEILHDLGLSGSDLVRVITKSVSIMRNAEVSSMKLCVDYLRKVLGSDEYVAKTVKKRPSLLSVKACERMRTNIMFFQSIGFSDVEIKKCLVQNPLPLLARPKTLKETMDVVLKDYQISRYSGMFIHVVDVHVSLKKSTVETKFGIFRSLGWSDVEIIKLVQLLPYCLRLSKKRLGAALNYYMMELGMEPAYLASHPALLMFSMEKRVLPRFKFMTSLIEKKLHDGEYNLYTVLLLSEQKFREAYLLPYKDKMPDVYEVYNKSQQHGKAKK